MYPTHLPLILAPVILAAPLHAVDPDCEADLPKVGTTLTALQSIARSAGDGQVAFREAEALLAPLNLRELYILALLLPEVAPEVGDEARDILFTLVDDLKVRTIKLNGHEPRWPGGECLPAPLDMQRVLAVTGRIATSARNARREAERSEGGYGEWGWKSPKRVAARREMQALIDGLDSPKDIYAVAVMLGEYQKDSGGNVVDWLLYQDAGLMPAVRLGKLGTAEAYTYFLKLHALYGRDGGGSLLYKEMEREYFGHMLTPARRRAVRVR